jgi:hypothetical protein
MKKNWKIKQLTVNTAVVSFQKNIYLFYFSQEYSLFLKIRFVLLTEDTVYSPSHMVRNAALRQV